MRHTLTHRGGFTLWAECRFPRHMPHLRWNVIIFNRHGEEWGKGWKKKEASQKAGGEVEWKGESVCHWACKCVCVCVRGKEGRMQPMQRGSSLTQAWTCQCERQSAGRGRGGRGGRGPFTSAQAVDFNFFAGLGTQPSPRLVLSLFWDWFTRQRWSAVSTDGTMQLWGVGLTEPRDKCGWFVTTETLKRCLLFHTHAQTHTHTQTQTHVACWGWWLTKRGAHITKDEPWISPQHVPLAGAVNTSGSGGCVCVCACVCVRERERAVGYPEQWELFWLEGTINFLKGVYWASQLQAVSGYALQLACTQTQTDACARRGHRCWFQLTLCAYDCCNRPQLSTVSCGKICKSVRVCATACVSVWTANCDLSHLVITAVMQSLDDRCNQNCL